jgi:tape measure domain-containing protein
MSGVEIRVRSNSRQARADLGKLERSVGNIEKTTAGLTSAFRNLAIGIGSAFAIAGVSRGINKATDSLTSMQNRVALVVGRGKELNSVLDDLYNISRRTGQPVDLAAETFNRFGLALSEAGKSSEEILKAVESVNKSIAISGGGVESARAALTQLGQGLASGTLRGEELNSVLEQAPRLAQAIADAMDKPRGALRKLAEQGELTTEVVFDALLSQSEKLSEEFATIEFTSAEALGTLRDQLGRVVAEVSKQLGITTSFTARIQRLSALIEQNRHAIVGSIVAQGRAIKETFSGVIAILRGLAKIITVVFGRALDAIPNLTTPFRDFAQVLYTDVGGALLYAGAFLRRFGLDLGAIARRVTDTQFAGAIRQIFQSRSLKDFGDALFDVGTALDRYGRRWYNFGNFADKAIRSVNVLLFETGIFLGFVDQRLFRLRYTSFERFGKAAAVLGTAFNDIKKSLLATNAVVTLQIALIKVTQLMRNFGKAIDNVTGGRISKTFSLLSETFREVASSAGIYLTKAVSIVKKAMEAIEYAFFWVYDKVIGNSWWTDTMEGTYDLAQKWLPKTTDFVKNFAKEISESYRFIKGVLSTNLNADQKFRIVIAGFTIRHSASLQAAKDISRDIATTLSSKVKSALGSLRDVSPQIATYLSLGIAAALTKAFSPTLFAKSFAKLGPLLFISIFTAVVTAFDGAVLKSGFFESVSRGLGNAVGQGINTIVTNIPKILKLMIRLASEFGKGLAETIGNSLIGIPAKVLSFIPGGGILTTLLYGGVAAAIFFKGVRTAMGGLIKSLVATSVGSGILRTGGLLDNIFLGSDPAVQRKRIITSSKQTLGKVSKTAAEGARRAGRIQLASFAGYMVGAQVLLGDLIGTTGAAVVGIGATLLQSFVLGDPARTAMVVNGFNSILGSALKRVKAFTATVAGSNVIGNLMGSFSGSATRAFTSLSSANVSTAAMFTGTWRKATARAGSFFSRFSGASIKKISKIAIAAVALSAAFAGMASASTGEDGAGAGLSTILSAAGFALLAFGDTILSYLLPIIGRLGKSIGGLGKTAAKSLGSLVVKTFGRMAAGAGAVAIGITSVAAAFAATAAAVTIGIAGGLIYSAFFGEGDSFLDRVKNNFDGVLAYFNLLGLSVTKVRKDSLKTLKSIENMNTKDIKIDLSATLKNTNISDASDTELIAIERAVNKLEKSRRRADQDVSRFGSVTEESRAAIKLAVKGVETAIREGKGEGSITGMGIDNLSPLIKALAKASGDRSGLFARMSQSIGIGEQNDVDKLLTDIKNGVFDLAKTGNVDVAKAFGTRALMALGEDLDDLNNGFGDTLKSILNQLSGTGSLSSEQTDQLARLNLDSIFGNLIAKSLVRGNIVATENFTGGLQKATDEAIQKTASMLFSQRRDSMIKIIEDSLGRDLEESEKQRITNREILDFGSLTREIKKLKEKLKIDFDKPEEAMALLQAAQGDDTLKLAADRLVALKLQLAAFATQKLKFSLEPGTIKTINSQLEELGVMPISFEFGSITNTGSNASGLQDIEIRMARVADLALKRAHHVSTANKKEDGYKGTLNQIDLQMQDILRDLGLRVELINTARKSEEQFLTLVESAAGGLKDRTVNFDDILKIDNSTLQKIANLQEIVETTTLTLRHLGETGFATAFAGLDKEELSKTLKAAKADLEKLFSGVGKFTGETLFEKFVGKLSDSNFSFDMESASRLSKKAVNALLVPLKLVKTAQDAIKNSAVDDSATRNKSLGIIKKQREQMLKTFTAGDFQTGSIGLSSFGLNPDQVGSSKETLGIGMKIVALQEQLAFSSFGDFQNRKNITRELQFQQSLLDGLTTQAMAATDSVKSAFSSSFKALVKGQSTIAGFFNSLLDSISNTIIDTVVDSFTTAFFRAAQIESTFDNLFAGLFSLGKGVGQQVGEDMGTSITGALKKSTQGEKGASWMQNLFGGASGGIFSKLGGAGGGGGLGSLLNLGMGLFGMPAFFNSGGIVPSTANSQAGKDSVPAMLTPGELIIPANKVRGMNKNTGAAQAVVNLSITGDISRQTKQEIIKMLPTIANGVNAQNKEANYRG